VAVLLPAHRARLWQVQAARSLLGLPGVEVQLCHVDAATPYDVEWLRLMATTPALHEVSASRAERPSGRCWDVVVDLAGADEARLWESHSRHGVWRICDAQGQDLARAFCCHTAICSGMGAELLLLDDASRVLGTLRFHTEPDYQASLPALYGRSPWLIKRALKALQTGGAAAPRSVFRPGAVPTARERAWQRRGGQLEGFLRRWLSRWLSESWMIGIVDAPIHDVLSPAPPMKIRWLGRRASRYYRADPFGLPGQSQHLYCEQFDCRSGLGHIVMLELDRQCRITATTDVSLPSAGHVSYPYLFEHEGHHYCVPETAAQRCCRLYEVEADGSWRLVTTLLEDVAAADATLFRWAGLFWLAYTDVALGGFDNLCLSWAQALTGPWQPHACNPVKIDHRSSRPGGTPFVHEGQLYRPAQDCGAGYGQAVVINRVTQCTPQHYHEELMRRLSPDPRGINPHGLHTISAWGKRTLVDGKRHELNLLELQRKLVRRLGGKDVSVRARARSLGGGAP